MVCSKLSLALQRAMKLFSTATLVAISVLSATRAVRANESPAEGPADHCSVCPDGASAGEDFYLYIEGHAHYRRGGTPEDYGGVTCAQYTARLKLLDAASEECALLRPSVELHCCPESAGSDIENPCSVCPGGASAGEDYSPGDDWTNFLTCGQFRASVHYLDAASEECYRHWLPAEAFCCPELARSGVEDPAACPDGTPAAEDIIWYYDNEGGDDITCTQWMAYITFLEPSMRKRFQQTAETHCCPQSAGPIDDPQPGDETTKMGEDTADVSDGDKDNSNGRAGSSDGEARKDEINVGKGGSGSSGDEGGEDVDNVVEESASFDAFLSPIAITAAAVAAVALGP